MSENLKIQPISFPPDILARISPDISLQRHLKLGLRPSLRKPTEFKPLQINKAGTSRYDNNDIDEQHQQPQGGNNILSSCIVKSGESTIIICNLSAGIIEDSIDLVNDYRTKLDKDIINANDTEPDLMDIDASSGSDGFSGVYTTVEISKGKFGPPTEEEISIAQELYQTTLHSQIIPNSSLSIPLNLRSKDSEGNSIYIPHEELKDLGYEFTNKSYSFVLYCNISIFSKIGPVLDLCHLGLMKCLKNCKLPFVYIDEMEKRTIKTSKGFKNVEINQVDLFCDSKLSYDLKINQDKLSWCSTFGVFDLFNDDTPETKGEEIILVDLEGDAEDAIRKRVQIVYNQDNSLSNVVVKASADDNKIKITRQVIKDCLNLARVRSKDMIKQI